MEYQNIGVTLDLNALLTAYCKEEFMKKVFMDFLKANTDIVASSLGAFVVMDLVKSGAMAEIAEKTKVSVTKLLSDFESNSFNSPIRNELTRLISVSVQDNKVLVNRAVVNAISTDTSKKTITAYITSLIEKRIISGLQHYESDVD